MVADHDKIARLLKTARGQIDGIMKMVDEDRYCIDISTQLMATQSLIAPMSKAACAALWKMAARSKRLKSSTRSAVLSKNSPNNDPLASLGTGMCGKLHFSRCMWVKL